MIYSYSIISVSIFVANNDVGNLLRAKRANRCGALRLSGGVVDRTPDLIRTDRIWDAALKEVLNVADPLFGNGVANTRMRFSSELARK